MKAARILFARRSSADLRVEARGWAHGHVEVLDHEPSAGRQRVGHRPQGPSAFGYVREQQPCMHEVERLARWQVGGDVVLADIDPRGAGARWVTSMSVATTVPVAPTRPASQVGTDAPPAPTSQQRQPPAMPSDVNVSNVLRSKQAARAAKRSSASTGASASR